MNLPHIKAISARKSFTLIELLVVLAVIAILSALLFPVFSRARESGRGSACISNEKQIGSAILMYLSDYDGSFPMNRLPDEQHPAGGCTSSGPGSPPEDALHGTAFNWKHSILPYIKSTKSFQCPSNSYAWAVGGFAGAQGDEANNMYLQSERFPNSYAYNGSFFHEAVPPCWYGEASVRPRYSAEVQEDSKLIEILESRLNYPDVGNWFIGQRIDTSASLGVYQSHNSGINILFVDGHAKKYKLAATCTQHIWTDQFLDGGGGCDNLMQSAPEYR